MSDVCRIPTAARPTTAKSVLTAAKNCESVLVLGFNPDGTFYAASNIIDISETLLLAQGFIHKVMNGDYGAVLASKPKLADVIKLKKGK